MGSCIGNFHKTKRREKKNDILERSWAGWGFTFKTYYTWGVHLLRFCCFSLDGGFMYSFCLIEFFFLGWVSFCWLIALLDLERAVSRVSTRQPVVAVRNGRAGNFYYYGATRRSRRRLSFRKERPATWSRSVKFR